MWWSHMRGVRRNMKCNRRRRGKREGEEEEQEKQ
jgi:hypothetical protein